MSRGGKMYKAVAIGKWFATDTAPTGFMLFSVWIHTIAVMIGVGFRIGWLVAGALMFTFPMSWLLYVGWLLFIGKRKKAELSEEERQDAEDTVRMMED